ncbi:MAG: hypothetical protein H8E91_04715 [Planctomycetes bacterium]|nr:hypothetical protein [Planctomycetota bacterium]
MIIFPKNRFPFKINTAVLLFALICGNLFAVDYSQDVLQKSAAQHLSEEILRVARTALQTEPLDVEGINVGVALIETAAEMNPDNPSVWRAWIEMAAISDDPVMHQRGVKELLRLYPDETPLQLARLRDAIDTLNTASERVALYEQLLSPEGQQNLNQHVASRLAFDSAMLQRQLGDKQQFARWLAESVALDPYFTSATAVAVGFFGDESADAYRRVELLTSLMLANMRDVTTQVSLAELLMSYGAYEAASRIYDIALADNAGNPAVVNNNLLSDMVMSHWGARDIESALKIIAARQRTADEKFRKTVREQQPRVTPLELARVHSPLAPKLATMKAAIYSGLKKEEAEWSLRQALDSFASILLAAGNQPDTPNKEVLFKENCLQAAWISVWLGDLTEDSEKFIAMAESRSEVSKSKKDLIEGWISLRLGSVDAAEKTFLSLSDKNDAAVVGLALVRLAQGKKRESAKMFLQVARDSAGTLLGIWSRNQLEKILGQQVVAREDTAQLESMIDAIPAAIDRYATDPTTTLNIRATALTKNLRPYQPILVEVELSNNGMLPMQIAQQGPIQPTVLLEAEAQVVGLTINNRIPIIVPIDRKLILQPRERFTVTVDLRNYWVGSVFNEWATSGGFLKFYAVTNFSVRTGKNIQGGIELVYEPSMLGSKSKQQELRVEGIKPTNLWLEKAIGQVHEMDSPDDLVSLVLLTWVVGDDTHIHVVEPTITPPPGEEVVQIPEGERHPLQDEATTAILMKFPSLDINSKAWILSVMSKDPSFESLVGMADVDESEVTTIGWMLRFVSPSVDEMMLDNARLLSAREDESPRVKIIANWVYKWIENRVAQRREKATGDTGGE